MKNVCGDVHISRVLTLEQNLAFLNTFSDMARPELEISYSHQFVRDIFRMIFYLFLRWSRTILNISCRRCGSGMIGKRLRNSSIIIRHSQQNSFVRLLLQQVCSQFFLSASMLRRWAKQILSWSESELRSCSEAYRSSLTPSFALASIAKLMACCRLHLRQITSPILFGLRFAAFELNQ